MLNRASPLLVKRVTHVLSERVWIAMLLLILDICTSARAYGRRENCGCSWVPTGFEKLWIPVYR